MGGLFAQMLGDPRFTAFAALSNEMYLTYDEAAPLPPHIARFIEDELIRGEIGEALFGLTTGGLDPSAGSGQALPAATLNALQQQFAGLVDAYIPSLAGIRAWRPSDFARRVLRPLRKTVRQAQLGLAGERLLARLDLRNVHLIGLIHTFFDYAALAEYFRRARVAELEQVSGAIQKFFVVPMPSGPRKQLMYDLTARIVDAENLPVNLVIISNWARTGWNVIKSNVLIDATATRDVVAWQQLRGRAMRALRTWTNDCYRLILVLAGSRSLDFTERADLPEDILRAFQEAAAAAGVGAALDERLRALLDEVAPPSLRAKIASEGLTALSDEERNSLAVALMLARNKVTHIYELVKAFGATIQVEYNRPAKVWQRRENIALKHEFEIAVQPFTGELLRGAVHAPLLYAKDPRTDLPAALQRRVAEAITGRDEGIVAGWLRQEATGGYQPSTKQPAEVAPTTPTEQTTDTTSA